VHARWNLLESRRHRWILLDTAHLAPQLVVALGGHGEYVTDPAAVGPAIDRACASGLPALVNIACDPAVAYPRSTNLA